MSPLLLANHGLMICDTLAYTIKLVIHATTIAPPLLLFFCFFFLSLFSSSNNNMSHSSYLDTLLTSARPFIRGDLDKIDDKLPALVSILRSVGAAECWHKHGTFFEHLFDTYRILKLWGAPDAVCLCGLFHSTYSNSYNNLAIFHPSTGRDTVRAHVGYEAESLIHLFCTIPRQPLIFDNLIFHYTESELMDHLQISEKSLRDVKSNKDEEWRVKINSLVPEDGVLVKHIRTGEDVRVSRRVVAVFLLIKSPLLITIADFSDQLFSFQDVLFQNFNGQLDHKGSDIVSLWPGDGKPGLWTNSLSKMGAVYMLIAREEEMMMKERTMMSKVAEGRDEDIELVIPPVFHNCTWVLNANEQIEARDLYWEAVCDNAKIGLDKAEELLLTSIQKNPFVGEPHVVLSQLYLSKGRFEEAETEAETGLILLLQWASPWDKRMSWEGWIAWARVLLIQSKDKSWPQTAFGILNLGLIR
ncbi:uncharacterized protein LOC141587097 [Silene latifolia]|uniref:uncharacterized protein LOC141587097 n=1 Tax=Silene latifolia TaxID=37657 RepID=UPI003D774E68